MVCLYRCTYCQTETEAADPTCYPNVLTATLRRRLQIQLISSRHMILTSVNQPQHRRPNARRPSEQRPERQMYIHQHDWNIWRPALEANTFTTSRLRWYQAQSHNILLVYIALHLVYIVWANVLTEDQLIQSWLCFHCHLCPFTDQDSSSHPLPHERFAPPPPPPNSITPPHPPLPTPSLHPISIPSPHLHAISIPSPHFHPITPCPSHHPISIPSPHFHPITPCPSHHPISIPSPHVHPITPSPSHHPISTPSPSPHLHPITQSPPHHHHPISIPSPNLHPITITPSPSHHPISTPSPHLHPITPSPPHHPISTPPPSHHPISTPSPHTPSHPRLHHPASITPPQPQPSTPLPHPTPKPPSPHSQTPSPPPPYPRGSNPKPGELQRSPHRGAAEPGSRCRQAGGEERSGRTARGREVKRGHRADKMIDQLAGYQPATAALQSETRNCQLARTPSLLIVPCFTRVHEYTLYPLPAPPYSPPPPPTQLPLLNPGSPLLRPVPLAAPPLATNSQVVDFVWER